MILDKEHFPRDKYCGDAVCTPALRILEDMGVMQVLRDANECHYADAGGFVSPSGLSYIGARRPHLLSDACHRLCLAVHSMPQFKDTQPLSRCAHANHAHVQLGSCECSIPVLRALHAHDPKALS